ncbi:paraquat-inducible protein A [Marinomonas pollencensis]|uniref:Paraquat-inducible protein A n=1 Tax=Marinomonas pollencensis TaxID=491954 RepID=A0A3E0DN79_9GAMM|nr:paraquat-inducible protein A [Marinomonas pollencensis]REG84280.1 paraquat-inducible protein A [Marinomonas pollencensis]
MSRFKFNEYATVCDECDLVNIIPPMAQSEKFTCSRCHHLLISLPTHRIEKILAYGGSGLLMLVLSLSFPFLSFSSSGIGRTVTFWQSMSVLLTQHFTFLGALLIFVLLVLPICYLLSVVALAWLIKKRKNRTVQRLLLRTITVIQPWLMVDVFLVGVLVALVKMQSMADISFGLSFWSFCGYVLCLLKSVSLVDRRWFWHQVAGAAMSPASVALPARSQGLIGCHFCAAVVAQEDPHCGRCGHTTHSRRPASAQITIALLVAASLMYIPANLLPIMKTTFLGVTEPSTILGGVFQLWGMGSYPIAIIILIASVFIPVAKILALAWLCWQLRFSSRHSTTQKLKLYRITECVGRWSMIDIFVVATLTGLVQMGGFMSVLPGAAALSFAAVVILTMLAAMSYDARLLWDQEQP